MLFLRTSRKNHTDKSNYKKIEKQKDLYYTFLLLAGENVR